MSDPGKGILDRLAAGPVIGDGGFLFGLEKRGYTKFGAYTPECVLEHTDAVKQFHREFLRAGTDVLQAFTYFSNDDKLQDVELKSGKRISHYGVKINQTACRIAREVANEGDALVAGGINETNVFKRTQDKALVQDIFRKQVKYLKENDVDFVICEYFSQIKEMEWAIEVAKESHRPVAATMCIGAESDQSGVPTAECAVRMAKAGADIVGVNCHFGPYSSLETMKVMKEALNKAGLKPYLMIQPVIYHTPDKTSNKYGIISLPEYPYALDARLSTRFEIAQWARDCYEAGIHYIGGCCGFEPHHIRAISEELCKERDKKAAATEQNGFFVEGFDVSLEQQFYVKKNTAEYWKSLAPTTGRPYSSAFACPQTDS